MLRPLSGSLRFVSSLVLAASVCACATPRGAAVLTDDRIYGCGFADVSADHQGRLLRVASGPERALQHGGAAEHTHSIAHRHDATIGDAVEYRPLGLSHSAASAVHIHRVTSLSTEPDVSSSAPNAFPSITMGLFEQRGIGRCVPRGAIIGFIGKEVPGGWSALDGLGPVYIRVATDGLRNVSMQPDPKHRHVVTHKHLWEIADSDPDEMLNVQKFRPEEKGDAIAAREHGHGVASATFAGTETADLDVELPFVELRLLRADATRSSLKIA